MTVTAFTTEKISNETIATAITVMDAMQSSPDNFTEHSTISNARIHSDDVYAFTPVMTGLAKPMDLSVTKGRMSPVSFTLKPKDNIILTIERCMSKKTLDTKQQNTSNPKPQK